MCADRDCGLDIQRREIHCVVGIQLDCAAGQRCLHQGPATGHGKRFSSQEIPAFVCVQPCY